MDLATLRTYTWKQAFLYTLLAAIAVGTLIGIYAFLMGEFGWFELRVLASTAIIAVFSVISMAAATLYTHERYHYLSLTGMIASALSFLLLMSIIWELVPATYQTDGFLQFTAITVAVTVGLAHTSLLIGVPAMKPAATYVKYGSVAAVAAAVLIFSVIVLAEGEVDSVVFRLLGVTALLAVAGTLATFILNRVRD